MIISNTAMSIPMTRRQNQVADGLITIFRSGKNIVTVTLNDVLIAGTVCQRRDEGHFIASLMGNIRNV